VSKAPKIGILNQMETMPPIENTRLNVVISRYYLKRLKYWAGLGGKTPSAFAGQILAARIEANFEDIDKQLVDAANTLGVTVEDLKRALDGDEE
jgi:hypothetical protein